jgi:hypothetical protein
MTARLARATTRERELMGRLFRWLAVVALIVS